MKKVYIVDGKRYEVPDSESGAFLKDFPTAKVSYNVEGKEYQIPHQEADSFEADMGIKKKSADSNAGATPSVNGSSDIPKVKEPKPSLADFGILPSVIPQSQQVNQPVSTQAVQPKVTATYDDFRDHNAERKEKKAKLVDEAIDNTARKILKNKGIVKPEEEGKALNLSQFQQLTKEKKRLQEDFANGDATFGISKQGEVGLNRTTGWWEALKKGWNESMQGNDDAAEFAGADAAGKVAFINRKKEEQPVNEHPEYIGERGSDISSVTGLVGQNAPFLVKAGEGAALGTALTLAAPFTGGSTLAGLPAATAFIFTANDAKNQGIQSEVTRRFYKLKQQNPDADEVTLMKQAEDGALVGGLAGIATNAALMTSVKAPLTFEGKSVVGKAITKAIGTSVYAGGATAGIEGAKLAEGNLEGIKTTPTEIAKEMGKTFSETATTLGILHVLTGAATGIFKLPKMVNSAMKYALKDADPQQLSATLKANEQAGKIPEGTADKVMSDIDSYKVALGKTVEGLSPEAEASVAGLIEQKTKLLEEQRTKDSSAKPYYDERIAGIDEQIQKTLNTGKPYAHEVDEISGDRYTTRSSNEPVPTETKQPEGQGTSTPVSASVEPISSGSKEAATPGLEGSDVNGVSVKAINNFIDGKTKSFSYLDGKDGLVLSLGDEHISNAGGTKLSEVREGDNQTSVKLNSAEVKEFRMIEADKELGDITTEEYNSRKRELSKKVFKRMLSESENKPIQNEGTKGKTGEPIQPNEQGEKQQGIKEEVPTNTESNSGTGTAATSSVLDEALYGKKEDRARMDMKGKLAVEPSKPISEMNSDELYDYSNKVKEALKTNTDDATIDNVSDLRDTSQLVNFVENSENITDLAKSIKSTVVRMDGENPSDYSLAVLNAAKNRAIEMGIDPKDLLAEVLKVTANDFKDRDDAATMMKSVFDKLMSKNEEAQAAKVSDTKESSSQPKEVVNTPIGETKAEGEGANPNQEIISITHEATDAVAKQLGLPEYEEKPETRAEWDAEVDKRLAENPNAIPEMLDKFRKKGKIDKYDQRMMLKYHAALKARINENPTTENVKQYQEAKTLSDIEGGREVAKSLVARQGTAPVEDNLANYLVAEAQSHGVETLPQETINSLKEKYDADQKTIAALNERVTKLEEEAANKKLASESGKRKASKVKKTEAEFKEERSKLKDSIRDKWKNAGKDTLSSDIPFRQQIGAIAPDVLRLVKSYAEEGIINLAEIVKKAHEELKIHIPEIEERDIRDIIRGDYTEKKQTRNSIAAQMRELKSQQILADKLESLQKGEPQIKDPVKKQRANEQIESLKSQIKDFNRSTPEESALKSLKSGLKNKIEKLKKDLETGDYLKEPEPKKPIKLDAEAQQLKDEHIRFVKETNIRRAKAEFENRGKGEKIYDGVMQVLSIKRIVETAVDLSIPFRQGVTLAFNPRRWKTFGRGFGAMMQSVFSTKKFDSLMYDIHKSADYQTMLKDKVVFNEMDAVDSNSRNEDFQKSFVYKIPLIREPLLASNRAADGFLNISRYEMYMRGKKMLERQGITRENSPESYEALGKWTMNVTGRGNLLKFLEDSHNGRVVASNTFFGARLMASRFNMLNPVYYMQMPKAVRVDALKDVGAFVGMISATLLAASAAGGKVTTDIDDPDYLKIKVGNLKYDISGGLVQYIRTYLRLNRAVSQRLFSPEMTKKEKDKYAAYAVGSTFNFFKYKLAPNTSYALSALTGKDPLGQPFNPADALKIYPMYIDDMITAYKDGGLTSFATVLAPSILGVGVQSYPDKGTKFNDTISEFIKKRKIHIADVSDKYKDGSEEKVMTEEEFTLYKENRQKRIEHDLELLKKNGLQNKKTDDESIQKAVTRIVTRAGEDAKAEVLKKTNKEQEEPDVIRNDRPLPVHPRR